MSYLDGLLEFVAVVESGTFTGAARKLSVSVSHVSRQVALLEGRLGMTLFHRTTRQMHLTAQGRRLFDESRPLLAELLHAQEGMRNSQEVLEGPIRVTLAGKFGEDQLVPELAAFCLLHPGIRIDVDVSVRNVDLVADGFDLAIRMGPLHDSPHLVASRLASFGTVVLGSASLLATLPPIATPAELPQQLCLPLLGRAWHFTNGRQSAIVKPLGRFASNSGAPMIRAALSGLGIVNVPGYYTGDLVSTGKLVVVLPDWRCTDESDFHLVVPASRHMPVRVRRLIEHLRNTVGAEDGSTR